MECWELLQISSNIVLILNIEGHTYYCSLCEMDSNGSWNWLGEGDDCYLQSDPSLGISPCLWDGANQIDEDLLRMFDEMTPIKACKDFDHDVFDSGEQVKGLDEGKEPSQQKRRRMLQFISHSVGPCSSDEPMSSTLVKLKDRGESLVEDEYAEDMQWFPGFPDDRCTSGEESFYQASEGWLADCFNDSKEMNVTGPSDGQVDISEFGNNPPEMEVDMIEKPPTPAPSRLFKVISGRKAYMQPPTKLATSVAYPFALIKPCGVQGDVTLKDINQRIRIPPPSKLKHKNDDALPSYPTSAFSGKPVVVKTKIRTEGGKGSITIMRTKG